MDSKYVLCENHPRDIHQNYVYISLFTFPNGCFPGYVSQLKITNQHFQSIFFIYRSQFLFSTLKFPNNISQFSLSNWYFLYLFFLIDIYLFKLPDRYFLVYISQSAFMNRHVQSALCNLYLQMDISLFTFLDLHLLVCISLFTVQFIFPKLHFLIDISIYTSQSTFLDFQLSINIS